MNDSLVASVLATTSAIAVALPADTAWLRVFLDRGSATDIPADGIGSVVRATVGTETWIGRIDGGSNYLSQSEMSAHFGLGTATIVDTLEVRWTNGEVTVLTDLAVNQTITVTHGATTCTGDLTDDGVVSFADILALIGAWGPCPGCPADLDANGVVDFADLLDLLAAWGPCS